MADHDDRKPDETPSPKDADRNAILKRRQQFIAAAIVGLAATGPGCIDACGDGATDARERSRDARPRKCLKMRPNMAKKHTAKQARNTAKIAEAANRAAAARAAQTAKQKASKTKQKQKGKSGSKR